MKIENPLNGIRQPGDKVFYETDPIRLAEAKLEKAQAERIKALEDYHERIRDEIDAQRELNQMRGLDY